MNDESIVEQEILSERAAAEALQSIAGQYSYPGGSALLNVKAELVPQANSLASGSEQRFDTDGNYPIGFEHTSDDSPLSLTNDVAIEEEESDLDS